MNDKTLFERVGDFMEGKGFYIVLLVCVTAIGFSSYFLFSSLFTTEPMMQESNVASVAGNAQVDVPAQKEKMPAKSQPKPVVKEEVEETPDEAEASVYTRPVPGEVSREFSLEVFAYDATMGDWRVHTGVDIDAPLGTEVLAVTNGTVKAIEEDPLMGTMVIIDHGDGVESIYANLAPNPPVAVGDELTTGAIVGAVGDTAIAESSMEPHLHFEMKKDGKAVDPENYLP